MVKKYFVLAGNHDCYYTNSNKITSLPSFFQGENFVLIENDCLVHENLVFVPWINEENTHNITEFVSKRNNQENYLFGHFEFSGFRHGKKLSESDQLYRPDYDKYKRVFSGHYHERQEQGNVLYLGNPWQKDFGELEDKYVHILDTETDELLTIKNEIRLFEVMIVRDAEDVVKLKNIKDKYCKIHIDSTDQKFILKVENEIDKIGPRRVSITYTAQLETHDEGDLDFRTMTNEELNQKYLERVEYPSEEERKLFCDGFDYYWKMAEAE